MRWLILVTKPQAEHKARERLDQQGYVPWLPVTGLLRRVEFGRRSEAEPLWPGYIWAGVTEGQDASPLRSTIGVRSVLMEGEGPKVFTDAGMGRIKAFAGQMLEHLGEISQAARMLMLGDILRVVEGPLEGKVGLCTVDDGGNTVTIGLDILGRQTPISLPVAAVRVVTRSGAAAV